MTSEQKNDFVSPWSRLKTVPFYRGERQAKASGLGRASVTQPCSNGGRDVRSPQTARVRLALFCSLLHFTMDCFYRRTADVRTVGYVECFVLSKDDVLSAIRDYPEAQVSKTCLR